MLKSGLKKGLQFARSHKLASAAFLLLPFIGLGVAGAIVAYQERKKLLPQVFPPVRDAVDEPVAPPSLDELEVVPHPLENAWRH